MKKLMSVLGVGAAVAATVLGGVTTVSTASAATQATPARCAGYGYAVVNAKLIIRSGAGANYRDVGTVYPGAVVSCYPVVVGNEYQACGRTHANGWIPIDVVGDVGIDGYLPSTCLTDY
jgi:hypothetical protein